MTGSRARTRSVYLDTLRAFALARVVVYHATSLWTVTAFTAMPLMFFIAGSLYAASIERRPTRQVVVDRYRRILFPYWLYVAALVVIWGAMGLLGSVSPLSWVSFAMPVLSFGGPKGPEGWPVDLLWIALWYLQMHLILSLIGGWLRRMQQCYGWRYWVVMAVLTAVLLPIQVGALFFYAICWSIGYLQHDGDLERWLRPRWAWIALVTGPPGALAFFAFHESGNQLGQALMAAGALLLGVFWLTAALGLRPRIEPKLERHWIRATVHWMSSRSLTVYLWHMFAIFVVIEFALPGQGSGLARLGWCIVMLPVISLAVGWAEDLAARRRPTLWPTLGVDLRDRPVQSVPKIRSPASPRPGSM